jgi:riboflavin biosynthesis pyrimidine reductase
VFGELLLARSVDELFLTLSPQIAGRSERSPRLGLVEGVGLAPTAAPWSRLQTVMRAADHLFLRYRLTDTRDEPEDNR